MECSQEIPEEFSLAPQIENINIFLIIKVIYAPKTKNVIAVFLIFMIIENKDKIFSVLHMYEALFC